MYSGAGMAGDWIKMRLDLWDHPKVVRILSAICPQNVRNDAEKCRIIGALFRTWQLFDQYTDDGILDGYTAESLNSAIGIDNWAENLQHVGWLLIREQSLEMPEFTTHNGKSAKRRSEDSKRKKDVRNLSAKRPQNVRKNADQRREEKRREEHTNKGAAKPPVCVFPSFEEVTEYSSGRDGLVNPREFYDYYESKGWKDKNGNAVKNWQAAFRTWEQRAKQRQKPRNGSQTAEAAWKGVFGVMHRWNPSVTTRELEILCESLSPEAVKIGESIGWGKVYDGIGEMPLKLDFIEQYEALT